MALTEIPLADRTATEQGPSHVFQETERWNYPRSNVFKIMATFWSFLVMGMNDAAYGVSGQTK